MKRTLKDKILFPYAPWWCKILLVAFVWALTYYQVDGNGWTFIKIVTGIIVSIIVLIILSIYNSKIPIPARWDEHHSDGGFSVGSNDKTYLDLSTGEISRYGGTDPYFYETYKDVYTIARGYRLNRRLISKGSGKTTELRASEHSTPNLYGYVYLFEFFFIKDVITFEQDSDAKSEFK